MNKKTHRIITTNSCKCSFITYEKDPQGNLIETGKISIGGGANVYNGIIVPASVGTLVSEDELQSLQLNPIFNRMVKNGFISVVSSKEKQEAVASDLEEKDNSAQMTIKDIKDRAVNVVNRNGDILVQMEQKNPNEDETITFTTQRDDAPKSESAPTKRGRRGRPSKK